MTIGTAPRACRRTNPRIIAMSGRALLRVAVLMWIVMTSAPPPCAAQAANDSLLGKKFNVDLVTGPLVGPNRVISFGGAYSALGYGIDQAVITPVSYGARTLWETDWFEYDVTLDYSPGALRSIDFINNGKSNAPTSDFLFVTLGGAMVFGDLGVGAIVRTQDYQIGDQAKLSMTLANYGACYALMGGQVLVGVGLRTALLTLSNQQDSSAIGTFSHTGPEAGAILALDDQPFRVGFAFRTSIEAASDHRATGDLTFQPPAAVVFPTEIQAGFAYQFGDRPLNRRWVNPHDRERDLRNRVLARRLRRQSEQVAREQREQAAGLRAAPDKLITPAWLAEPTDPVFVRSEAELVAREDEELKRAVQLSQQRLNATIRALSRTYLLVSADLLFVGETSEGIGLESFLSQRRQDSGRNPSLAFRLGAEGEPIPNYLRLRIGSYLEPSRFAGIDPRLHGTVGCDVKLFSFDMFGLIAESIWRVSASLDVAARYRNVGFSIGIWH